METIGSQLPLRFLGVAEGASTRLLEAGTASYLLKDWSPLLGLLLEIGSAGRAGSVVVGCGGCWDGDFGGIGEE